MITLHKGQYLVDDLIGVSRREEYKQDKLHTFQKNTRLWCYHFGA